MSSDALVETMKSDLQARESREKQTLPEDIAKLTEGDKMLIREGVLGTSFRDLKVKWHEITDCVPDPQELGERYGAMRVMYIDWTVRDDELLLNLKTGFVGAMTGEDWQYLHFWLCLFRDPRSVLVTIGFLRARSSMLDDEKIAESARLAAPTGNKMLEESFSDPEEGGVALTHAIEPEKSTEVDSDGKAVSDHGLNEFKGPFLRLN